jgi:hypothetical protein
VSEITKRVERGAALLDEKRPGWWQGIDLDRLDISSCSDCIAGQIGGGNYLIGAEGAGLWTWEEDVAHGFGAEAASFAEYGALTAAWRDLIVRRREGRLVSA